MSTSTVEILEQLVAFDTTSARPNLGLIDWVETYLADHGVASTRLPDASEPKAGLVARIGPERAGGVVLCGHTDVVPVSGQHWTREPFRLTVEGDRLYGRGTTDMKGFIASALAAVPALVATDLTRPVTLAWTHDEEVGCLGAPALAEHLASNHPIPAVVITGEPTGLTVARAHKGIRALRTTVTGAAAHSSRPTLGVSAITAAARLVMFLEQLGARLATDGVRAADFDPPHTTVNVGTIDGGSALNIVPARCELVWEYRWVPGEDVEAIPWQVAAFARDELLPPMRAVAPDAAITTEVIADVPALDPAGNHDAARVMAALGAGPQGPPIAFATDAAVLQHRGIPSVVCGPGSMTQGHQPDEYIERAQLDRCDELMASIGRWAASPAAAGLETDLASGSMPA